MQWRLLQIEREMSFLLAVVRSSKTSVPKLIEGRVERLGFLWTHVVLTATAMLSSQTSQTWPPVTNVKAGACFSNVAKLFGWHKSLCVFNMKTFQALNLAVIQPLLISETYFKKQLFTASGSQSQELLFEPDKLTGISRNDPQDT